MRRAVINQSLIKKLLDHGEDRGICPRRTKLIDIEGRYKPALTNPMLYGRYFESLCIGSCSHHEKQSDLPRKKLTKKQKLQNRVRKEKKLPLIKGDKKVAQERIEAQALRFKEKCEKMGIKYDESNTQVEIYKTWDKDKNIILNMTLDMFPVYPCLGGADNKLAIVDIKATSDIHSTYGDYCYGIPDSMDHTQASMYHYGVRDVDFDLNDKYNPGNNLRLIFTDIIQELINSGKLLFLLWIFSYSKLEDKFINVVWNSNRQAELHESIRKVVETIKYYNSNFGDDWPTRPNYDLCEKCPIIDCEDRETFQTV